ncbi:MAG TPA: hypothetical protein VFM42_00665 [Sphingomicrobium sp.]|nr:hypothetical protein [Sphingomicrobium sp.]
MTTGSDSPATGSNVRLTYRQEPANRSDRSAGTAPQREAKLRKLPRGMRVLIFLGLSLLGWALLGLGAVLAVRYF